MNRIQKDIKNLNFPYESIEQVDNFALQMKKKLK